MNEQDPLLYEQPGTKHTGILLKLSYLSQRHIDRFYLSFYLSCHIDRFYLYGADFSYLLVEENNCDITYVTLAFVVFLVVYFFIPLAGLPTVTTLVVVVFYFFVVLLQFLYLVPA